MPPLPVSSSANDWMRSTRRAPSTTLAPCAERSRAVASPSPLLAPVMTTTFPSMLLLIVGVLVDPGSGLVLFVSDLLHPVDGLAVELLSRELAVLVHLGLQPPRPWQTPRRRASRGRHGRPTATWSNVQASRPGSPPRLALFASLYACDSRRRYDDSRRCLYNPPKGVSARRVTGEGVYDAEHDERDQRTTGPSHAGRPGGTRPPDRAGAAAGRSNRSRVCTSAAVRGRPIPC